MRLAVNTLGRALLGALLIGLTGALLILVLGALITGDLSGSKPRFVPPCYEVGR